jgi:GntR family transcriptional regulator
MIRINYKKEPNIHKIVRQFKYLIATGSLKSVMITSSSCPCSTTIDKPNTVAKAYRELESDGLIYTRPVQELMLPSPELFSDEERIRILSEKVDVLLTEASILIFLYLNFCILYRCVLIF